MSAARVSAMSAARVPTMPTTIMAAVAGVPAVSFGSADVAAESIRIASSIIPILCAAFSLSTDDSDDYRYDQQT